ncbi:28603_t:CDS:1, partial [Racocetra persica]
PRVAAFHFVFVLDCSGSMSNRDCSPTAETIFGKTLQGCCNNRLGSVLQAIDNFIKTRISSTCRQNISTTIGNDIVSIIFFNGSSEVLFENKSIFETDFIQNKLVEKRAGGLTCFSKAIETAEQIIDNHFDSS